MFVSLPMAQKEMEDKQLANTDWYDFHITKGAVWIKRLGLSTTNQLSYNVIPHDFQCISGQSFDDMKLEL